MTTADKRDYAEVFGELAAVDPTAAEQLLDVATMILEAERRITQELGRRVLKPLAVNHHIIHRKGIKDAVRTLHEGLVKAEAICTSDPAPAPVAHTGLMVEAV